jgi:hypothetical protein
MKAEPIQKRWDPTYVSPKIDIEEDVAEPVANPAPPIDGKKPISPGSQAVEEFMVTNDTGGGD